MAIRSDILQQLVPQDVNLDDLIEPSIYFDDHPLRYFTERLKRPQRQLAMWSGMVRQQLRTNYIEDRFFRRLFDTSAYIGVGIFRPLEWWRDAPSFAFPIVEKYQFGIVLLRTKLLAPSQEHYWPSSERAIRVRISGQEYRIPMVEFVADFAPHSTEPDGYVAATFDENGQRCGITARHVLDGYSKGQQAPIYCPDCNSQATVMRKAPGCVDAAVIEYSCGYNPGNSFDGEIHRTAPALEGSMVELHLGKSGTIKSTVMLSLQTNVQIISAAAPKSFLVNGYGVPGDSGSLIANELDTYANERSLVGLYLGDCVCEDASGASVTYGYGLDIQQAVDILGTNSLKGEPND